MTALAVVADGILVSQQQALARLVEQIRGMTTPEDVNEARAQIAAARAWAKVHGEVKAMRLSLLTVEVEALVRLTEMCATDGLTNEEVDAGLFFAAMTEDERATAVLNSGTLTTAGGLGRTLRYAAEYPEKVWKARQRTKNPPTADPDPDWTYANKEQGSALLGLLERRVSEGVPFTIEGFADDLLADLGLQNDHQDPAVVTGIREVCREAIRKAPVVRFYGQVLPRIVTARLDEDGTFIRIPIEHARLEHLDSMIAMKREQLAQDQRAFDRLVEARERLAAEAHGDEPLGAIIDRQEDADGPRWDL